MQHTIFGEKNLYCLKKPQFFVNNGARTPLVNKCREREREITKDDNFFGDCIMGHLTLCFFELEIKESITPS